MWSPTHVQVTVCRIKGLLTKGKNGTNDAFVTISLGKEKFQTSVKQKALSDLEWQEECELAIPTQGNTAEIVLTALHQNFIGVDEFLGMVSLPLSHFDVYERPRTKWYPLKSKPGQEGKNKHRGEIEVRVAFTVKSGSLLDLSKKEKHKGSFGHISQAAHNIGSKLRLPKSGARDEKGDGRLSRHSSGRYSGKFSSGEPDPGVISEDDDEFRFDELSHKSSGSSLNLAGGSSSLASGQGSLENLGGGELLRHNSMKRSGSSATLPNRAIQSSSSISSLAVSATSGGSKSPSQQQNDWNQKFFGAKQSKVSETPVGKQSEEKAPVLNVPSSPTSLMAGGVPSIIIQDSFIVEEPSLSPSSSPSLGKSNNNVAAPVPKARNNKNQDLTMEVEVPVVVPQPRQRKELPTVEEVPVEIKSKPTAVTTPVNTTNETHRMKMAASFHQRVVVGEDKPANNNTSRDHHRTPRDTSTTEDRLRVYQEKSREGLISLLEDRDSEISDLKDYIDSLLLRVIDTCPTVLQTPVKAKQSTRK